MATLREIRRKTKSMESIKKMTKAIQMIAAARFARVQNQVTNSRNYYKKLKSLFDQVISGFDRNQKYFQKGLSGKEGILVITSDKGLCSSYNISILKRFMEYASGKNPSDLVIFAIGKKARDYFKRNKIAVYKDFFDVFKNYSSTQADIIADEVLEYFMSEGVSKFTVIYMEFHSLFSQHSVTRQILPIKEPESAKFGFDFKYEPDRDRMAAKIFSRYLKAELYQVLLEAYTSELAARRNAMENATNNASDLIDSLILNMNKIRQQQITREIAEIVGTAEANR